MVTSPRWADDTDEPEDGQDATVEVVEASPASAEQASILNRRYIAKQQASESATEAANGMSHQADDHGEPPHWDPVPPVEAAPQSPPAQLVLEVLVPHSSPQEDDEAIAGDGGAATSSAPPLAPDTPSPPMPSAAPPAPATEGGSSDDNNGADPSHPLVEALPGSLEAPGAAGEEAVDMPMSAREPREEKPVWEADADPEADKGQLARKRSVSSPGNAANVPWVARRPQAAAAAATKPPPTASGSSASGADAASQAKPAAAAAASSYSGAPASAAPAPPAAPRPPLPPAGPQPAAAPVNGPAVGIHDILAILPKHRSLCNTYVATRRCKFGSGCRAYHPTDQEFQAAADRVLRLQSQQWAQMFAAAAATAAAAQQQQQQQQAAAHAGAPVAAATASGYPATTTHRVYGPPPPQQQQHQQQPLTWQQQQQQQQQQHQQQRQQTWQQEQQQYADDMEVVTSVSARGVLVAHVGTRRHPIRPEAGICRAFMKNGFCQWDKDCRHHHPLERAREELCRMRAAGQLPDGGVCINSYAQQQQQHQQQQPQQQQAPRGFGDSGAGNGWSGSGALAPHPSAAYAVGSGEARVAGPPLSLPEFGVLPPGVSVSPVGKPYVEVDGKRLPYRPKLPQCTNLLNHGKCSFGMSCRYNHFMPELHNPQHQHQHPQQQQQQQHLQHQQQQYPQQPYTPQAANPGYHMPPPSAGPHAPLASNGGSAAAGMPQYGFAGARAAAPAPAGGRPVAAAAPGVYAYPVHSPLPVATPSVAAYAPGGSVAAASLLAAVDAVFPPSQHEQPQVWALNRAAQYLVLHAAWHVRAASGGSAAVAAAALEGGPSGMGGRVVRPLSELLAASAELGTVQVRDADLRESGVLLARVGADMGTLWRREAMLGLPGRQAPYEVKLGPLLKAQGTPAAQVFDVHVDRHRPAELWVRVKLDELIRLAAQAGVGADGSGGGVAAAASAAVAAAAVAAVAARMQPQQPTPAPSAVQPQRAAAAPPLPSGNAAPPAAPALPAGSAVPAAVPTGEQVFELLVASDNRSVRFVRLPAGAATPGAAGPLATGRADRDDAIWRLLALFPPGLAAQVAPFCWATPASSSGSPSPGPGPGGMLTSITLPCSGPPVLRFRDASASRLLLNGVDAPLDQALARLAACSTLLLPPHDGSEQPQASQQAVPLPGSDWAPDPRAPPMDPFSGADALLVPGTLHRVLATRDACGAVSGITYRVGRQPGIGRGHPGYCPAALLADILSAAVEGRQPAAPGATSAPSSRPMASPGVLVLGPPGSGKTTALRALARAAALHLGRAVVVLDSSWELGGLPLQQQHSGSGGGASGSSLSVADLGPGTQRVCLHHLVQQQQAGAAAGAALVHAVVNAVSVHMPDVVVMDDLTSEVDAGIAKTLAQRGIVVLAAAHARDLHSLVHDVKLSATCGVLTPEAAAAAAAAAGGQGAAPAVKRTLQVVGPPSFSSCVELVPCGGGAACGPSRGEAAFRVHADVAVAVEHLVARETGNGGDAAAGACHAQLRFVDASRGRMLMQVVGM